MLSLLARVAPPLFCNQHVHAGCLPGRQLQLVLLPSSLYVFRNCGTCSNTHFWRFSAAQVVFLPSSLYVSLLFEGIIWFLLPTALVIVNDIMAYLAGAYWVWCAIYC